VAKLFHEYCVTFFEVVSGSLLAEVVMDEIMCEIFSRFVSIGDFLKGAVLNYILHNEHNNGSRHSLV